MQFFKKEKCLLAVCDGKATPLTEVPDEAFSSGILGKGFAVLPSSGTVYAPASGTVQSVAESRHAYTILTPDGLDLLIHVGIDTVELKGEGFLSMVTAGDKIRAGDAIARADLKLISQRGFHTAVAVVITNPEKLVKSDYSLGKVLGGKSEVLRYQIG